MSFSGTVWAIDGVSMPGQLWRLQLQSASRSGNGIVDATDLAVSALSTPGPQVSVASGGCVALGAESSFQGSYYGYNVGAEQVPVTPTDSGGGRSDLLVAQVKDPTFPGSAWQSSDPPWSFQVITGVAAGTTEVPAGITAVPLARIDIPVSTSAITQAMIHDVRQMLSPRQQRSVMVATPPSSQQDLTSGSFATWPPAASWQVAVPSWAGKVVASLSVSGAACPEGATYGQIRWNIGGTTGTAVGYDLTVPAGANYDRFTAAGAAQATVPASIRGTTVTAAIEGVKLGGSTYQNLYADSHTSVALDIEFIEAP